MQELHSQESLKILFFGPQGSGKGTQAQILSDKFDLPIFATGNILRQKIQSKDDLGLKLKDIINKGELVSDKIMNQVIAEKIRDRKKYVLDGYPRTMAQAYFLSTKDQLTHVFEVYVSDEDAIRRISGRRTCPKCQTVYHLEFNPSKETGLCDKCHEALKIREDETEEALRERLKNYHEQTEKLADYYKTKGVYIKINGEASIPEVTNEILNKIY